MALRQAAVLLVYGGCLAALALAPASGPDADGRPSRVDRLAQALSAEVDATLNAMAPLAARLGADDQEDRLEWRAFARLADTGVPAPGRLVAWVPYVPAATLAHFEAETGNDGYRSFRVVDLDPRGRPISAARRGEHFPIHLAAPARAGEALLGLDLAAHPELRAGIVRARQNHTPQVVGPLRLGPSGRCAGLARPLCEPQLVVILPVTGAARAPAGVLVGVLPWHALAAVVGDAASVDALLSRQAVIAATARLNRRRR